MGRCNPLSDNIIRRKQLVPSLQRRHSNKALNERSRGNEKTRKKTKSNTKITEELFSSHTRQLETCTNISKRVNCGSRSPKQRKRTVKRSKQTRQHQKIHSGGQYQPHPPGSQGGTEHSTRRPLLCSPSTQRICDKPGKHV